MLQFIVDLTLFCYHRAKVTNLERYSNARCHMYTYIYPPAPLRGHQAVEGQSAVLQSCISQSSVVPAVLQSCCPSPAICCTAGPGAAAHILPSNLVITSNLGPPQPSQPGQQYCSIFPAPCRTTKMRPQAPYVMPAPRTWIIIDLSLGGYKYYYPTSGPIPIAQEVF